MKKIDVCLILIVAALLVVNMWYSAVNAFSFPSSNNRVFVMANGQAFITWLLALTLLAVAYRVTKRV